MIDIDDANRAGIILRGIAEERSGLVDERDFDAEFLRLLEAERHARFGVAALFEGRGGRRRAFVFRKDGLMGLQFAL